MRLDLRRIEVHRDDADDQQHTEDDVQNRYARVIGSAGGQVSPFTRRDAEGEVAAAFKGIYESLSGNGAGAKQKAEPHAALRKYLDEGTDGPAGLALRGTIRRFRAAKTHTSTKRHFVSR